MCPRTTLECVLLGIIDYATRVTMRMKTTARRGRGQRQDEGEDEDKGNRVIGQQGDIVKR